MRSQFSYLFHRIHLTNSFTIRSYSVTLISTKIVQLLQAKTFMLKKCLIQILAILA